MRENTVALTVEEHGDTDLKKKAIPVMSFTNYY